MFSLPVFVGLDYHTQTIHICVMNQQRKILVNQSVANDAYAVFQVVAPFGTNVSAAMFPPPSKPVPAPPISPKN